MKNILLIIAILCTILLYNSSIYADDSIIVKKIYPPKCTLLKETNGLLCPRIMEIEVFIKSKIDKHLIRCTLYSEEEEVLAFGESFLIKPGGKIYLILRTRTRLHGLTLIADARCTSDSY